MVRLWTLEAFAHGAEVVSYFRWRQAPFGQEQMHAGLLRPDRRDDVAAAEVRQVAAELPLLDAARDAPARVALIFDYEAEWVTQVQPQGEGFSALRTAFEWYEALRSLGLDVDIRPSTAALAGYALVVMPCLPIVDAALVAQLGSCAAQVLVGPRTGSKTAGFSIPPGLPPGELAALLPLRVARVESLREGLVERGAGFEVAHWLEHVETALKPEWALHDGRGVLYRHGRVRYLAGVVDAAALRRLLAAIAGEAGLPVWALPPGLRLRRQGELCFAFNYSPEAVSLRGLRPPECRLIIGTDELAPAGVAAWILPPG
jgi:beta-galactosidase